MSAFSKPPPRWKNYRTTPKVLIPCGPANLQNVVRFVQNIFIFPEILPAPKNQKTPIHTKTWSHQTTQSYRKNLENAQPQKKQCQTTTSASRDRIMMNIYGRPWLGVGEGLSMTTRTKVGSLLGRPSFSRESLKIRMFAHAYFSIGLNRWHRQRLPKVLWR